SAIGFCNLRTGTRCSQQLGADPWHSGFSASTRPITGNPLIRRANRPVHAGKPKADAGIHVARNVQEVCMNIVKWDPFRELEGIQARLNRMFGDRPFRGIDADDLSFADWAPAVDIQET